MFEKSEIEYRWNDCSIGFVCPICGAQLVADAENGQCECECGLKYHLETNLKIEYP